ncbi:MAG: sigma-70 family RNA polymerase sigma factor [Myxococcota bacterium]|nr:sigma-70 family RNA polymerase sigma factor [Deltaproteobacteria bacterium]MDQ3340417.1 sigma-70 family RNA polymerase sigma factor [Myxococcota bacterium]
MALLAQRVSKNSADWSDRDLLKCVLRSDARGWAELIRRFRPLIYRCITKVTLKYAPSLGSADLDEIYADVMMQLVGNDMHKLRIYNPARGTKLGSWIGMISVNAAYDFLRSAGRRPLLDKVDGNLDPHEECDRTPLDQLIEKERWDHLNSLLSDFTAKDRTFVELYYQKGLEAEEIASEMQISLKTVYSKKHKIRAHLVRVLQNIAGDSPIADLAAAAAA